MVDLRPIAPRLPRAPRLPHALAALAAAALLTGGFGAPASAHDATFPVAGRKLLLRTDQGAAMQQCSFYGTDGGIRLGHDPSQQDVTLLVRGTGPDAGRTELVTLDRGLWQPIPGKDGPSGYQYADASGSRGGITSVVFQDGTLRILAEGENWSWAPTGSQDSVWVHAWIDEEEYCVQFGPGTGASVHVNQPGYFWASGAAAPASCPEQVCGNGELELGEACDDGNLIEDDGCTSRCEPGVCIGEDFATTFDALQSVVFEGYGCTNAACHGASAQGGLVLTADQAWPDLVSIPAQHSLTPIQRVEPGEPETSFLYQKLAAKTLGTPLQGGSPMPLPSGTGPAALSEAHLNALALWISGGAPNDRVVAGTAQLLATCLPDPDPLKLEPVPPPAPGTGFQVRQPPRPLPAGSESEVCSATFYDLTDSSLIPADAFVPCPPELQFAMGCSNEAAIPCSTDADCDGSCIPVRNVLNPDNLCLRYNRFVYAQDPQSHHALVREYRGAFDQTHPGWESWSYRFEDESDPRNGQGCDPTEVDPATGINAGCGTDFVSSIACIGYGPPDFTRFDLTQGFGGLLTGGGSATPSIAFTGEPYLEGHTPEGSAEVIAARGMLSWNSHAFNLTTKDSTLAGYLNLYLADPVRDTRTVGDFFDANSLLVANVKPFEAEEYCRTFTVPSDHALFKLSSHTHRHGVLFRIWPPPNTPCVPGEPACQPRDDAEVIYRSTEYSDPVELILDPPVVHSEADAADRSYLYCGVFDNGAEPGSPSVKRHSASPRPPLVFGIQVGGPCAEELTYCANEGPMKGALCAGSDATCDSSVGAGDGDCDACTLLGGLTTEDSMFAMLGSFVRDNCPDEPNPGQEDADGDGVGDVCDIACSDGLDNDGDGLFDSDDPGCGGSSGTTELPFCSDPFDADGDGYADSCDNCLSMPNGSLASVGGAPQLDSDGDDVGNACDADLNNDQFVGGPDFDIFLRCLNQATGEGVGPPDDPTCEESDMNGDAFVGGPDFDLFLQAFNMQPGPGAQEACGLGWEVGLMLAGLAYARGRIGRRSR